MRAVTRLAEQEFGTAGDDLFAEIDEGRDHILDVHQFRAATIEGNHVATEGRLHRGEPPQLVEHNLAHRIALQLDHNAHAVAVGLIAQIGNTLDPLFTHQIGDLFDQRRFVDLIRNFGDDNGFPILADFFNAGLGTHDHRTASGAIGIADAATPQNRASGRKIGPRHDHRQIFDRNLRISHISGAGINDFTQIVRWNIGGHADGNPARTIDKQVGITGWQNHRLMLGPVIIGLEIDGFLIEIFQQAHSGAGQTHFGVTHRGGGIAIHRTEIALPVNQRQTHREALCHTHQRVIDRLVTMGMVFTDHVTDDTRRFAIGLVGRVAVFIHRIENAPMHGLQAVAHIGERTRHDHAHRVIKIAALHLIRDGNRTNVLLIATAERFLVVVGQNLPSAESLMTPSSSRFPGQGPIKTRTINRQIRNSFQTVSALSGSRATIRGFGLIGQAQVWILGEPKAFG